LALWALGGDLPRSILQLNPEGDGLADRSLMRSKGVTDWAAPKPLLGTVRPNGTICARMYHHGSLFILRAESAFCAPAQRAGAMTVRCLTLRYSHGPDIMAVGGTGRPR